MSVTAAHFPALAIDQPVSPAATALPRPLIVSPDVALPLPVTVSPFAVVTLFLPVTVSLPFPETLAEPLTVPPVVLVELVDGAAAPSRQESITRSPALMSLRLVV